MSKEIILKKNQILFRESEPATEFYILKQGKILIVKREGSRLFPVSLLQDGDLVGAQDVFNDGVRSASAIVLEECKLSKISGTEVANVLSELPPWLKNLFQTLADRLGSAQKLLSENMICSERFVPDGHYAEQEMQFKQLLDG